MNALYVWGIWSVYGNHGDILEEHFTGRLFFSEQDAKRYTFSKTGFGPFVIKRHIVSNYP